METLVIEKVVEQLKELPYELQWRVLEFTRALALTTPRGVPGSHLLRFAGAIPASDVELMRQAIKQGCERVSDKDFEDPVFQLGACSVTDFVVEDAAECHNRYIYGD